MGAASETLGLFGILAGALFYLYFPLRNHLTVEALGPLRGKPGWLYGAAWGWAFAWLAGTCGVIFFLGLTLQESGLILCLLLAFGGNLGWLIMGFMALLKRGAYKNLLARHPPPKLQLWMQDLYVTVFLFGALMALFFSRGSALAIDT